MGNSSSRHQQQQQHREHGHSRPASSGSGGSKADSRRKERAEAEAAIEGKTFDVVITSTPQDQELAVFLNTQLESASVSVYTSSSVTDDAVRIVSKVLVDTKLLVFVASESTAQGGPCQDQVSLAYISNKPIIVVSQIKREVMLQNFEVGMKLTLQSLNWTVFDNAAERDANGRSFVQTVQDVLTKGTVDATATEEITLETSARPTQRRLNTRVRAQTTMTEQEGPLNTFWDRNFKGEDEVAWFKFQQAFLTTYEVQLQGLFNEDNMPWLLGMLKNDIFGGTERVTKELFMQVRGDSPDTNAFWRAVSQTAVEKFNMKEVFNMNSSVRLTAIERLATFQNPAVIEALLQLLLDEDPNVRAVAAISLGRTGTRDEAIIDKLIALLKDGDRIVRQSACLSLGSMKAAKAIPAISDRWRNDFISVVRNAARTALENMDDPMAKEVLRVTKVLEDEITALEGGQVAV